MITGPGGDPTAAASRDDGRLRASHADREQVIGRLKVAFVQGRLTGDELGARAEQAYASRTYADLAEVTADLPPEPTTARPPRAPWRATKIAWAVVYALILPGIVALVALPGGPGPLTGAEVATYAVASYAFFWVLGVFVTVAARRAKHAGGPRC